MTQVSPAARIEHVNLTVSNLDRSIDLFEKLCGWHVRVRDRHSVRGQFAHVGGEDTYLALWSDGADYSGQQKGKPMNHVGLLVDDLDAAERVVTEAGLCPFGHDDYEPGRRFYFFDRDGVILTRRVLDLGRLKPHKTQVLSFPMESFRCEQLGEVLLNEALSGGDGAAADCTDLVQVSHRGGVPFVK